jgi:DUF971 family protein
MAAERSAPPISGPGGTETLAPPVPTGAPEEVRVSRADRRLELIWPERTLGIGFATLRRNCRCADCTAIRRAGGSIEVADDVDLLAVNPMGTGALQFVFSDGHERGIFPWPYLCELA